MAGNDTSGPDKAGPRPFSILDQESACADKLEQLRIAGSKMMREPTPEPAEPEPALRAGSVRLDIRASGERAIAVVLTVA